MYVDKVKEAIGRIVDMLYMGTKRFLPSPKASTNDSAKSESKSVKKTTPPRSIPSREGSPARVYSSSSEYGLKVPRQTHFPWSPQQRNSTENRDATRAAGAGFVVVYY